MVLLAQETDEQKYKENPMHLKMFFHSAVPEKCTAPGTR